MGQTRKKLLNIKFKYLTFDSGFFHCKVMRITGEGEGVRGEGDKTGIFKILKEVFFGASL